MSEFILINCPPWGVAMPPLGIAYLTTYLKAKNIEVKISDLNLQLYQKADKQQIDFWGLDTINRILPVKIAQDLFYSFEDHITEFIKGLKDYRLIGFSANNLISATFAGMLGQRIRELWPGKILILGGPGCYHSWDRKVVPKEAVDFFIIGEGEEALEKLIQVVKVNQDILKRAQQIPGLLLHRNNQGQRFYPAISIKDLSKLPYPTFEEFDLKLYNYAESYRPLPILISRGCINRCSYCIDWYMSGSFRLRKPEHIVAEMKHHVEHYQITHVEFNDLLCNGNLAHLEQLCDQLIEAKLKITWISYAAIRKDMDGVLLAKMKKAGCSSLCYGIESGADAVLKRMNKRYVCQDAAELIKRTYKAGIEVRMNIIVGFPGETTADFNQTLDFIRTNKKYISQVTNVSSFVLMPGADLSIYPHRFGIVYLDPNDLGKWTDENGLTQEERNNRVIETCQVLKELGIRNLIINYQKQICKHVHNLKKEKILSQEPLKKTILTKQLIVEDIEKKDRNQRKQRVGKSLILFSLFIFSLIIDFYLIFLKKIRGSIIFPGN